LPAADEGGRVAVVGGVQHPAGERLQTWQDRPVRAPERPGPRRHLMTAPGHRTEMTIRFAVWDQITRAAGQPATVWTHPDRAATTP
jgi:hypothetical protein